MSQILRDAILNLLRRLEWSGRGRVYDDNSHEPVCPVCGKSEYGRHAASCELDACIDALEKENPT